MNRGRDLDLAAVGEKVQQVVIEIVWRFRMIGVDERRSSDARSDQHWRRQIGVVPE